MLRHGRFSKSFLQLLRQVFLKALLSNSYKHPTCINMTAIKKTIQCNNKTKMAIEEGPKGVLAILATGILAL